MGTVYFTRHGQTVWNVENKICGATDIPLTELGHQQAIALGEQLLAENRQIHRILYSPLIRAAETARHIARITGIPAQPEPRLTEQNFGIYESTPRNGEAFRAAKAQFVNSFGTGESMLRVAQRVYNLLDELKQRDETVLLVAHNGIARVVRSYFTDMSNQDYEAYGIGNCEIVEYHF